MQKPNLTAHWRSFIGSSVQSHSERLISTGCESMLDQAALKELLTKKW
jgi:hypothetical protein